MKSNKLILVSALAAGFLVTEVHAATEWNVSLWGKRRAFTENVEKLAELVEQGVPLVGAAARDQVPLPRDLAEAVLFVVVIHVGRPGLHVVVFVHRLEQSVVVRQRTETEARRILSVHLCDTHLPEMRRRAEAVQPGFFE